MSWKLGLRIIDLGELARQMYCGVCKGVLDLNCTQSEQQVGLVSVLVVECGCGNHNIVQTGKLRPQGVSTDVMSYDVNVKAVQGMLAYQEGEVAVTSFLTILNIPAAFLTDSHSQQLKDIRQQQQVHERGQRQHDVCERGQAQLDYELDEGQGVVSESGSHSASDGTMVLGGCREQSGLVSPYPAPACRTSVAHPGPDSPGSQQKQQETETGQSEKHRQKVSAVGASEHLSSTANPVQAKTECGGLHTAVGVNEASGLSETYDEDGNKELKTGHDCKEEHVESGTSGQQEELGRVSGEKNAQSAHQSETDASSHKLLKETDLADSLGKMSDNDTETKERKTVTQGDGQNKAKTKSQKSSSKSSQKGLLQTDEWSAEVDALPLSCRLKMRDKVLKKLDQKKKTSTKKTQEKTKTKVKTKTKRAGKKQDRRGKKKEEVRFQCNVCQKVLPSSRGVSIHMQRLHYNIPTRRRTMKKVQGEKSEDDIKRKVGRPRLKEEDYGMLQNNTSGVMNPASLTDETKTTHTNLDPGDGQPPTTDPQPLSATNITPPAHPSAPKRKRNKKVQKAKKWYQCPQCTVAPFPWVLDYTKHMQQKHGVLNPHQCRKCAQAFPTSNRLKVHRNLYCPVVGRHECSVCLAVFPTGRQLRAHRTTHSREERSRPLKRFVCKVCGQEFGKNHALQLHVNMHEGTKPYQCLLCEEAFFTKPERRLHYKACRAKKKVVLCELCGRRFGSVCSLRKHELVHTGEKPHQCKFCEKTFTRSNTLIIHERQHTGETPYVCDKCGSGFKQRVSLVTHMRSKHNINATYYSLPQSGPRYTHKDYLAGKAYRDMSKSNGGQVSENVSASLEGLGANEIAAGNPNTTKSKSSVTPLTQDLKASSEVPVVNRDRDEQVTHTHVSFEDPYNHKLHTDQKSNFTPSSSATYVRLPNMPSSTCGVDLSSVRFSNLQASSCGVDLSSAQQRSDVVHFPDPHRSLSSHLAYLLPGAATEYSSDNITTLAHAASVVFAPTPCVPVQTPVFPARFQATDTEQSVAASTGQPSAVDFVPMIAPHSRHASVYSEPGAGGLSPLRQSHSGTNFSGSKD